MPISQRLLITSRYIPCHQTHSIEIRILLDQLQCSRIAEYIILVVGLSQIGFYLFKYILLLMQNTKSNLLWSFRRKGAFWMSMFCKLRKNSTFNDFLLLFLNVESIFKEVVKL